MLAQWDDHEVTNDWCAGRESASGDYARRRASSRWRRAAAAPSASSCRCAQTLAEVGRIYRKISYGPLLDVFLLDMRSYRTPDAARATRSACDPRRRCRPAWLKRELMNSHATWKVIAADLPISAWSARDAVAQGDGPPLGRECEIADLLAFIKHAGVRNTVWITADMHYTAAHYYDPEPAAVPGLRAVLGVRVGPAPCRHLGAGAARQHVRPAVMYQKGCSKAQGENLAPCFGLQFFGHVAIDGDTEVMTVTLKDVDDRTLWSTRIEPRLEQWSRAGTVASGPAADEYAAITSSWVG